MRTCKNPEQIISYHFWCSLGANLPTALEMATKSMRCIFMAK